MMGQPLNLRRNFCFLCMLVVFQFVSQVSFSVVFVLDLSCLKDVSVLLCGFNCILH